MRIDLVRPRAEILKGIRRFFDGAGFVETTTPVWIAAPAPEPHIDCPPCGAGYLRASPELQMKKLLAAGLDKIYQIGPCFRDGERGSRHNPEFTMIEWYRLNADYRAIADDLRGLLASLATGALAKEVTATSEITVREAYAKWAGWDPWTTWDQDRFDYDMAEKIEPNLPATPTFLFNYPPQAASLSRVRENMAERWELYWHGMELANCFTELCDAVEQRRRFEAARAERRLLDEADYPLDDEFLDLLNGIPAAAGVALGVDRLVMVLTGASRIADVL